MVWENIRVATIMFRYTQMLSMQYISRRINYRVRAMVYLQYSQFQNKCNGFVRRRVKVNSTLSKQRIKKVDLNELKEILGFYDFLK